MGRFLQCPGQSAMRPLPLDRYVAALVAAAVLASATRARAAQDPQTSPPAGSTWTAAAGVQQLSFRDIARTGPPVDASPVAREGAGPVVTLGYRRVRPDRLHRFEFAATAARDFSYVSVRGAAPLPPDDNAGSLEARYEYRRYPWRDLALRGLDVGVGVEAILDRVSVARSFPPAIEIAESAMRGGAGIVAAVRLGRWPALDFEAAWTNAAVIASAAHRHNVDPLASSRKAGPGWITDLDLTSTVRMTRHVSAVVTYRRSGEGLLGTRPAWAIGRSRVAAGIAYAR